MSELANRLEQEQRDRIGSWEPINHAAEGALTEAIAEIERLESAADVEQAGTNALLTKNRELRRVIEQMRPTVALVASIPSPKFDASISTSIWAKEIQQAGAALAEADEALS